MQVFVKPTNLIKNNETMNTLICTIKNDDNIFFLLKKVSNKIKVPICKMYLVYSGKNLEMNRRINEYNIYENSTIYLHIRINFCINYNKVIIR